MCLQCLVIVAMTKFIINFLGSVAWEERGSKSALGSKNALALLLVSGGSVNAMGSLCSTPAYF